MPPEQISSVWNPKKKDPGQLSGRGLSWLRHFVCKEKSSRNAKHQIGGKAGLTSGFPALKPGGWKKSELLASKICCEAVISAQIRIAKFWQSSDGAPGSAMTYGNRARQAVPFRQLTERLLQRDRSQRRLAPDKAIALHQSEETGLRRRVGQN